MLQKQVQTRKAEERACKIFFHNIRPVLSPGIRAHYLSTAASLARRLGTISESVRPVRNQVSLSKTLVRIRQRNTS